MINTKHTGGLRIEFHMLQNVPPSNMNRDDQGAPKQITYGGVNRLRVSSQAHKSAMRTHERQAGNTAQELFARRTKLLHQLIIPRLTERGVPEDQARLLALHATASVESKAVSEQGLAAMLLFGYSEADAVAELIAADTERWLKDVTTPEGQSSGKKNKKTAATKDSSAKDAEQSSSEEDESSEGKKGKKEETQKFRPYSKVLSNELKAVMERAINLEVALYGRMLASNPDFGKEGALQVAHSLGISEFRSEFDYLTGMDEEVSHTGAAMIEQNQMASSVIYRYVCLDLNRLRDNLADMGAGHEKISELIKVAVNNLTDSLINALPAGRKTTMANNTPVGYLLAGVTQGGNTVALSEAFLKPIGVSQDVNQMQRGILEIQRYWQAMESRQPRNGIWKRHSHYEAPALSHVSDSDRVKDLQKALVEATLIGLNGALPEVDLPVVKIPMPVNG